MRPETRLCSLFPVLLCSFLAVAAAGAKLNWGFRRDGFHFEAVLAAQAADLDADGRDELVISGRNYQDREACLEVLRWDGKEFTALWRSPNLMESESTLFGLPVMRADGPAVVALTRTGYMVFRWRDGSYAPVDRGPAPIAAEEAAAGDLDGDGVDELVVTATRRNTKNGREKELRVLAWRGGRLVPAGVSTEAPGNIRSLAAGDLDRDGLEEVVAELGPAAKSGEFRVYRYREGALHRASSKKTSLPAAAYGLAVAELYPEPGLFLLAGCQPGRIRSFRWSAEDLVPAETAVDYTGSPVSLAAGDLDGDGRDEIVVINYPARLQILFPAADYIGLERDGKPWRPAQPLQRWEGLIYAEYGDLLAVLGGRREESAEGYRFRLPGPGARDWEVTIDPGLAVRVRDAETAVEARPRLYAGYLYLPVAPFAGLAGWETSWDEERRVLVLRRGPKA
ncbi:MAG: FG-GAP repeat domain-containing protein [Bacteroidota bacterium]